MYMAIGVLANHRSKLVSHGSALDPFRIGTHAESITSSDIHKYDLNFVSVNGIPAATAVGVKPKCLERLNRLRNKSKYLERPSAAKFS
jgi:hypothetical protein